MFLKQACTPRQSVFNKDRRDVVLDLSDLLEGKSDGEDFFDESHACLEICLPSGAPSIIQSVISFR